MAKLRLNQHMRDRLVRLAEEAGKFPELEKTAKTAQEHAEKLVRRLVEKEYPPKDMAILARYSVATKDDCIMLRADSGGDRRFQFDSEDNAPLTPNRPCSNRMFIGDAEVIAAVDAAAEAHAALKTARKQRLADYRSLIAACRTLEEVAAVWPAAESVRGEFARNEVMVISPEIINRIRVDVGIEAANAG